MGENKFIVISKELLKQRSFSGNGHFGKVTIQPMNEITLVVEKEYVG